MRLFLTQLNLLKDIESNDMMASKLFVSRAKALLSLSLDNCLYFYDVNWM